MQIFHAFCSFVIFWDTDIPNMSNWMVLYSNLKFGWGLAPSSPPPPPPCWASRCSWRSPLSLRQFSKPPSIFPSNICMSFNLRYCFWVSDNKQRNYTQCQDPLVYSWWWMMSLLQKIIKSQFFSFPRRATRPRLQTEYLSKIQHNTTQTMLTNWITKIKYKYNKTFCFCLLTIILLHC